MSKTVQDVMTSKPITVNPKTLLTEAIKILASNKISGMPVVNDGGKLVGVISETDLMWRETGVEPPPYFMFLDSIIYLENPARYEKEIHKALGQIVEDVMTKKSITVSADEALPKAAHLMMEKKIRRLIVVDDNGLVIGILTRGDIIRSMANI